MALRFMLMTLFTPWAYHIKKIAYKISLTRIEMSNMQRIYMMMHHLNSNKDLCWVKRDKNWFLQRLNERFECTLCAFFGYQMKINSNQILICSLGRRVVCAHKITNIVRLVNPEFNDYHSKSAGRKPHKIRGPSMV